jgi:hypothetical protein
MAAPKGHPRWGGRTKGQKNVKTLAVEEERRLLREQILAARGPMTEAQINHAQGVSYMVLRNPDGTFTRATDEKQIDAACAIGAYAFKIFTQAPNQPAYATLMAYAVDKPKEQPQELQVKGTLNVTDVLKQRHARRKKAE